MKFFIQVNEENEAKENEEKISKSSKVSLNSKKSNTSDGQDTKLRELKNKYEKLQAEVDTFKVSYLGDYLDLNLGNFQANSVEY